MLRDERRISLLSSIKINKGRSLLTGLIIFMKGIERTTDPLTKRSVLKLPNAVKKP